MTAGRVVGLTENPQTNCRQCEDHIRQILEKDGLTGYEVRIYDSLEPYRKALEDLAALAGTSEAGTSEAGTSEAGTSEPVTSDRTEDGRVMKLLYSVSL